VARGRAANERGDKVPWRTTGDYYSFKEAAIKQHAPTISGVYGLFNFRHQILIDSAANIRVALLHHLTNTNFCFSRVQPTGFIFEPCAPETREMRVQELIQEYGPIVQPRGGVGLATLWQSLRNPHARAFHPELSTAKKPPNNKIPQVAEGLPEFKSARYARVERKRFGLAGATCGVIFLGVGSIGLIPQLKSILQSIVLDRSSITGAPVRLGGNSSQAAPVPAFKAAAVVGQPSSDMITRTLIDAPEEQEVPITTDTVNVEEQETTPSLTSAPAGRSRTAETPKNPPDATRLQTTRQENPGSSWTVQALATPDKQIANDWMQRLKVKGYDAFVMEASIRGQTWHRVRVGNFGARRDAEALRAALVSAEGLREPFVARNNHSESLLTLNRR
jgi:cell division septation protein DedD